MNHEIRNAMKIEQAEMILNEQDNFNNHRENVLDVFENFNDVLRNYGTSRSFNNSLTNSRECYKDPNQIPNYLSSIQKNTDDSFLVIPLLAKGHLFSSVIRKVEEDGKDKFSMLVVNMGARAAERGEHRQFEEYVFDRPDNLLMSLSNILSNSHAIKDVYNVLENNASQRHDIAIKARDQIVGNCYLKEVEKGIKASLVPHELVKKQRVVPGVEIPMAVMEHAKYKIGNKTIDTEKIHLHYLDILAGKNPEIAPKINQMKESYMVNKMIRSYWKGKSPIHISQFEINKNIDYKTMIIRDFLTHMGLDKVPKFTVLGDFKDVQSLFDKINKSDESVMYDLKNISQDTLRKYPRLMEQLGRQASALLSEKAEMHFKEFMKTNNVEELKMADQMVTFSQELYQHNSTSYRVKAKVEIGKGNFETAMELFERTLLYNTEAAARVSLKPEMTYCCTKLIEQEMRKQNAEGVKYYTEKLYSIEPNHPMVKEVVDAFSIFKDGNESKTMSLRERSEVKKKLNKIVKNEISRPVLQSQKKKNEISGPVL